MNCELVAAESGARMALDRRSFLMCALASGAALGAGEFAAPAAASPAGIGRASAERCAIHLRGEVLREAGKPQDQVQAVPARVRGGRQGARLLRRARESRRRLLHAGALARVRGAHRSHREEAALPLPARHQCLLDCHGGMQRQLQILPELGHLAVAPRGDSGAIYFAAPSSRHRAQVRLPHHRLHLQRAGGLCRIPDGHRGRRARSRRAQHRGLERLHAA